MTFEDLSLHIWSFFANLIDCFLHIFFLAKVYLEKAFCISVTGKIKTYF